MNTRRPRCPPFLSLLASLLLSEEGQRDLSISGDKTNTKEDRAFRRYIQDLLCHVVYYNTISVSANNDMEM